jgi:NIPSNAP
MIGRKQEGCEVIVELREYSLAPGTLGHFVDTYGRDGWPVQSAILGRCLGWYATEIGDVNEVVHLWAYDDAADRSVRRQRLSADPGWAAFLQSVSPDLSTMKSRLLRPLNFDRPNSLSLQTASSEV